MSEPMDDTPVFNYVASIQGREFIVTIFENKMSQWDDLSGYGSADRLQGNQKAASVISVLAKDEIFIKASECFVLRVKGDSMAGAHIVDGDLVVLELRPPHDGAIVATLIDGEATLKRYVVRTGKPFPKAENLRYPELVPAQELVIPGLCISAYSPSN